MSKGFAPLDRAWIESEEWLSEPFDKVRAWIDIFTRASYADTEAVKRGQLITSERSLATRWKWPRSRVTRILEKWEKEGRITRTNNRTSMQARYGTTITVENYEKYQASRTTDRTNNRTTDRTYKNNINNLNNISLNMPDGMEAELLSLYGDRTTALIEDVRRYYEGHPDKEFPGWKLAMAQFNANQARWGKRSKKREMSLEEIFEGMD